MAKHYIVKETILETYEIIAKNRKEALELMKSGYHESPSTVTILKQVLVKAPDK